MFLGVTFLVIAGLWMASVSPARVHLIANLKQGHFKRRVVSQIAEEIKTKVENDVNSKATTSSEMIHSSPKPTTDKNETYKMECGKGGDAENVSIEYVKVIFKPSPSGKYSFTLTTVKREPFKFTLNSGKVFYLMTFFGPKDGNNSRSTTIKGSYEIKVTLDLEFLAMLFFSFTIPSGATRVYGNEDRQQVQQQCALIMGTKADLKEKTLIKVTKGVLRGAFKDDI